MLIAASNIMEETMAEDSGMIVSAVREFSKTYGPYAFGVVSLLVIWFVIVSPELEARSIDFNRQQDIVHQIQTVANTLEKTAVIQSQTMDELNRLFEQMKALRQ